MGEYMSKNKEILNELRNDEKSNKEILRQLVIERIKTTSDNKFRLDEIKNKVLENNWQAVEKI